jgi:glycosyltransferase involved in cell wall biosynthesis
MMKVPLFSIVIPTYNRSELVQGAVRSVLRQTFEDFEVVVSDNCSQDDTREVIERFEDPRVRYVRTPTHGVIADSWEFARSQSRGTLVMMLSDDDALVHNALARFAEGHRRHGGEFLFCNLAEYRDRSFLGPDQNVVTCRPFSDVTRRVPVEEFLTPLFAFRPKLDMHPSAFMFAARVAERVVQRCGRFFRTNGVEYFAWPPAAVFAKTIVYIDAPLVILGRTAKSWGSTVVLSNPGKQQIQKMIADADQNRGWVPLTNFTLANLMAEGMLLSKQMFPDELQAYPFDEQEYLRTTMEELRSRLAMGVDVNLEMQELLKYAEKYPALKAELMAPPSDGLLGHDSSLRKLARILGISFLRRRLDTFNEIRKIKRGQVQGGFWASGGDFGFSDALGCADFVSRATASVNSYMAESSIPVGARTGLRHAQPSATDSH